MATQYKISALACSLLVLLALLFAAAPSFAAEETFTNSIGMTFVRIPAGSFVMGDAFASDAPPHLVSISTPFYLGIHEVTQEQWHAVMGGNPAFFKGRQHPVEQVSWEDAQAFIQALNKKEGHTHYRLPTEAEWEYAARAGTTTAYPFGNEEHLLGEYAWYWNNSGETTHPVGQKKPNPWGLYDMHGNVLEWVQDWYGNYPPASTADSEASPSSMAEPKGPPASVIDPKGPPTGAAHVLRGGSWLALARYCRSATRASGDRGEDFLGFRVVREGVFCPLDCVR